jgi:glucokinase
VTSNGPILGLDVGGTKLAAGVVDRDGTTRSFQVIPTDRDRGPDAVIERLVALGADVLATAGLAPDDVDVIGIGCGGPLDVATGRILGAPNLPGWNDVPIVARVEAALGRPAVLENDATAAALAEWRWGAGAGASNLVYLTISTGIGGGVIADGRVLRGAHGNAAELGHLSVRYDGWLCPGCGRRGCPEAFASGTNIARRAREALAASDEPSVLRDVDGGPAAITARDVSTAAAAGDPVAEQIWNDTTDVIGELVASCLDAFDPDVVVLGGGVTEAGDLLLEPVRARAHRVAMTPMRATPIVRAALGARLGVLAAAAVALEAEAAERLDQTAEGAIA